MEITISKEDARKCGYHHSGKDGVGLYLMGDGIFEICERLPFLLGCCPTCGEGVSFGRGFTWITPRKLFAENRKPICNMAIRENINHDHVLCNLCVPPDGKHGLLWCGEKFYTPGSFLQEAVTRGISKRVASIPKDFKVGETVVYLAHNKAMLIDGGYLPGVFTVFKPSRVDIVVDTTNPDELPKRAISIAKRLGDAARVIKVEPVYEQQQLF